MAAWIGPAVQLGTSLVGSILGGSAQRSMARAQQMVDRANAEAANKVRRAGNGFAAAQASLSNLMRSLGNQGRLRAGGEAINALNTNLVRLQDQAATCSLNQQISAAEQMGALRAAAAASGAGGTSAAMLHQTLQLAHARATTTRDQNQQYQTYDALMQRAGLAGDMALSVDTGQDFAQLDYGASLAPFRAASHTGGAAFQFLTNGGAQAIGQMVGNLFI